MIRRYDASGFSGVTDEMKTSFEEDGVLVLDNMVPAELCDRLRTHMLSVMKDFDASEHSSVFSSVSEAHAQDAYFLSSGYKTRFFFEEEAFDGNGNLTRPLERAINKVGHAMHDLDPVFDAFSRQSSLSALAKGLGLQDPRLAQSMYIFKQPEIGGEVKCHQDGTYIRTEPNTCLGLWIALEDATEENGCLWGIPGGHKGPNVPRSLFVREGTGTKTVMLDDRPFDETHKIPLPAPKGTVLAFGGLFPHMSCANRSTKSRHAYTLHIIDGVAKYPADNWLQRPTDMPFQGF